MTYVMKDGYGELEVHSLSLAHSLQPRIQECIQEVLSKTGWRASKTFVVGDFGAADGVSSAVYLKAIAPTVIKAGGPGEISYVLEDQEKNDFRPAFVRFRHAISELEESLGVRPLNVLVSSVGGSFFSQCLPSNSVNFSISVFAAMFLDTSRPLEKYQIGFSLPLLRRWREVRHDKSALTEAERAQVEATTEKAAVDWERFLVCRAKELQEGGRVMVSQCSTVPLNVKGFKRYSDGVITCMDDSYILVANAVHELVNEGKISADEEQTFVVPCHHRSLEEIKAPFLDENSPVRRAGLRICFADYILAEHPLAGERESFPDLSEEELKRKAGAFRREVQTYMDGCVRNPLAKIRGAEEVDSLTAKVFQRAEDAMFAERSISMSQVLTLLVAEKTGSSST